VSLDARAGCSFSAGAAVASSDNDEWSLYGAPWLQPVATGRKSPRRENGRIRLKPLPWVAAACRIERTVREGVDGSSPSEGSAKARARGFSFESMKSKEIKVTLAGRAPRFGKIPFDARAARHPARRQRRGEAH
jgi:hypothetical protein